MKTLILTAGLSLFAAGICQAGEAQPTPNLPPGAAAAPACNPAAYVAGVDATGREVAPADLAPQATLSVGALVVPRIRTPGNPNVRDVQIGVELDGLNGTLNPPPCAAPVKPEPQNNQPR